MLKKLIKKDLQATSRIFLPLILGFVIISILAKILFEVVFQSSSNKTGIFINETSSFLEYVTFIIFFLYIFYIIVYYVMTYVFIIYDFYKTMVGNQGYLTHTLPVKTRTIINSKLINALFWQCVAGLMIFLSLLLLVMGHVSTYHFQTFLIEFYEILQIPFSIYMLLIILCLIAGCLSSQLMFYASIAIGHLSNKNKLMCAILSYLGIYTMIQIISTIVAVGFIFIISFSFGSISINPEPFTFLLLLMSLALIISIISSCILYYITNFILSKKLNLE